MWLEPRAEALGCRSRVEAVPDVRRRPHVAHPRGSDHRMDIAEQGEQEGSEKELEAGRPAWR